MHRYVTGLWLFALALHAGPVATAAPAPPLMVSTQLNFTFFVCGDSRGGDGVYTQILAAANDLHAAFLIHTGDMVPVGADVDWDHFEQLMRLCKVSFFPVAGNHDVGTDGEKRFLRWTPAHKPHYSFDYGQLHFAMVNDSLDMSSSELAWLDADLKASTRPVKIVTHHMPAWNPDGAVYGMGDNREAFLEVLRAQGVRFDFCGHDHGYRSGTTNGTTLVVSGGGGAPLYHAEKDGGFHHYVEVNVAGTNVTFRPVRVTPERSTNSSASGTR